MNIIEITNNNFEKEVLQADKVLVDFNAEWCGPCRMLKPILEDVSKELTKTKVVSINVDNEEELAKEYNVFSIPCLVLIEKGQEVKRKVGFTSKEELIEFIGE